MNKPGDKYQKETTKRFIQYVDWLIYKGESQKSISENLKITSAAITKMRRGNSCLGMKSIYHLRSVYKINLDWLILGIGKPPFPL